MASPLAVTQWAPGSLGLHRTQPGKSRHFEEQAPANAFSGKASKCGISLAGSVVARCRNRARAPLPARSAAGAPCASPGARSIRVASASSPQGECRDHESPDDAVASFAGSSVRVSRRTLLGAVSSVIPLQLISAGSALADVESNVAPAGGVDVLESEDPDGVVEGELFDALEAEEQLEVLESKAEAEAEAEAGEDSGSGLKGEGELDAQTKPEPGPESEAAEPEIEKELEPELELSPSGTTDECEPVRPRPRPGTSGVVYQIQTDTINSCAYLFPATLPGFSAAPPSSGAPAPSWVLTRPPERYSSAAPLSPDGRLRIVSERLFVKRGATISVAISPPNDAFLSLSKDDWTAIGAARSVLADRTSPRMTTAQRLQETVVGRTASRDICGVRYFYFEFLNSRSPTTLTGPVTAEVFRHSVAATAEREGYLYTITASCLDPDWDSLGPLLQDTVDSFRLLPPTSGYVPPWKDPWRFW